MSKPLVIIPTFNEKENITHIIEAIFQLPLPFDVLVVDDNSPDGTGQIVESLQNKRVSTNLAGTTSFVGNRSQRSQKAIPCPIMKSIDVQQPCQAHVARV